MNPRSRPCVASIDAAGLGAAAAEAGARAKVFPTAQPYGNKGLGAGVWSPPLRALALKSTRRLWTPPPASSAPSAPLRFLWPSSGGEPQKAQEDPSAIQAVRGVYRRRGEAGRGTLGRRARAEEFQRVQPYWYGRRNRCAVGAFTPFGRGGAPQLHRSAAHYRYCRNRLGVAGARRPGFAEASTFAEATADRTGGRLPATSSPPSLRPSVSRPSVPPSLRPSVIRPPISAPSSRQN